MKGDKTELEVTASRFLKPTEKGMEYKTHLLKQSQTTALSAVSRKCTDIKKLITDRNNLHVVKTELVQLDRLVQQFHNAHNLYYEALISPEDKEHVSHHFTDKESDMFEYRKEVVNWVLECEAKISKCLDGLSEVDRQSRRSRSSRSSCSSRSSRASRSSISVQSARMKGKAKVAELMAERSMPNERLQ